MLGRRKRYFFQLTGFTNAKKAELKTVITKLGGNFVENDVGLSLSFCRAPFELNSLEYGPYCPPPPPNPRKKSEKFVPPKTFIKYA